MHNTAKQTSTGEVMAHFNLSDAEWDGLPSFVRQKLATVYYRHAAAPAMYEALKEWCDYYAAYNPIRDKRIEPFIKLTRKALAQAEGR